MAVCLTIAGCAAKSGGSITADPSSVSKLPDAQARDAVLVGNNWEGTVIAFDPQPPFRVLAKLNVLPDRATLDAEAEHSLARQTEMALIRGLAGEGHDQLVDDVFTSPDGRYLYASRPSYKDVIAIDLADPGNAIPHWRTRVEGKRADHAAISADGTRLLVSASTKKKVHEIDTATGKILRSFSSGDEPHENNYSHDGTRIFHASIGRVFLPTTSDIGDRLKGDRWFEIVDARSFKVLERYDMRKKTEEFGQKWKDSAVRPMAISPDDKTVYFQLSFLHGFYAFDVDKKRIVAMQPLPENEKIDAMSPHDFQLNSADHGITINGDGTKLCVAGTLLGKAYIVRVLRTDPATIKFEIGATIDVGPKPYWATTSADGGHCYVSVSEKDQVVVISFEDEKEVGRVPVGRHPQRIRNGRILVSAANAVAAR